jgi:hypothetical protein
MNEFYIPQTLEKLRENPEYINACDRQTEAYRKAFFASDRYKQLLQRNAHLRMEAARNLPEGQK